MHFFLVLAISSVVKVEAIALERAELSLAESTHARIGLTRVVIFTMYGVVWMLAFAVIAVDFIETCPTVVARITCAFVYVDFAFFAAEADFAKTAFFVVEDEAGPSRSAVDLADGVEDVSRNGVILRQDVQYILGDDKVREVFVRSPVNVMYVALGMISV